MADSVFMMAVYSQRQSLQPDCANGTGRFTNCTKLRGFVILVPLSNLVVLFLNQKDEKTKSFFFLRVDCDFIVMIHDIKQAKYYFQTS